MDIKLTTASVDISVALKAHRLYKEGNYSQAIVALLDILDNEPQNAQARLYLGICYFKTNQAMAAQRALRVVFEKAADPDIRQKACTALQIVNAHINERLNAIPPEFGHMTESRLKRMSIESVVEY